MSNGNERLFETLEPPRGGLARLHARLRRDALRHTRRRRTSVALAAGLVVTLVGWLALVPPDGPEPASPELDLARLSLGQLPGPSATLTIPAGMRGDLAARRVPLPRDDVVFYRIASLGRAAEPR